MSELSPAAQEVITASNCAGSRIVQLHIAAALRAAADQVAPLQLPPEGAVDAKHPTVEWHVWNAEQQARFALLAIATELEAQ